MDQQVVLVASSAEGGAVTAWCARAPAAAADA
jgi:hypothetical protein